VPQLFSPVAETATPMAMVAIAKASLENIFDREACMNEQLVHFSEDRLSTFAIL